MRKTIYRGHSISSYHTSKKIIYVGSYLEQPMRYENFLNHKDNYNFLTDKWTYTK